MQTVLLVDDSEFLRMRLTRLLEGEGYRVVEANDGAEGVEMYFEVEPDLVLMDITMPNLNGIEATDRITSRDDEAVVVMCSALGQQRMVLKALKAGAKDFIVKPYDTDKLLATIAKHLI